MTYVPHPNVVIPELLQGQWTSALICTFGVSLTFFETRLMSQLAQVPLRVILADNAQLATTLDEAARTGQRHRLANKAYVAAPIRHPRAAHGKMMLLLGPSSGRLIVGSGNLGYDGYASPGELWHVFAYSDDQPQHVNEFGAARSFVDGLASRQLIDPPVIELLQTAWSGATWLPPTPATSSAITSNLNGSIIEQFRDFVSEPVDELIAHAPFHDADCAALQQLITSFAPKRVRLLVTDATSADPDAMQLVLSDAARSTVELVQVKDEPGTNIHAKWVHLIHPLSETLLTGSANLSRAALLRSSGSGNIEIGVISSGPPGAFDGLYAHLQREQVKDISTLGISYRGSAEDGTDDDSVPYPTALWSRLDGSTLTVVFSEALTGRTNLELEDHAGRMLAVGSVSLDGVAARVGLTKESAELVADGGRVLIRLNGDDEQVSFTWPYHIAHLRGRLDKASLREHLTRIRDLPDQDAELYELLRELDQTLIIDRESVWRIAKPGINRDPEVADGDSIGLQDLDWERVRRDPRYGGYFTRGRTAGLPPTDIQVVLAAIGGRLGDLGLDSSRSDPDDEGKLAEEGDAGLSAESEDLDEELQDELTRRRLPISTRTRMAFDRFVRRYAAALGDRGFISELGPIPAATNAVVFDYLLAQLLDKAGVSPRHAIEAQVVTWRFLWGNPDRPSVVDDLDDETAEAVGEMLTDARARVTTLRGLASALGYDLDDETLAELRDVARHLLTDAAFGLDAALLSAAGGSTLASSLLATLAQVAEPSTPAEMMAFVVAPLGLTRSSVGWRNEQVQRAGRVRYQSTTFVVTTFVPELTVERARELLGRVAVAAYYEGHDTTYARVRFEANGKAVAFWDEDVRTGVAMIDDHIVDLESIDPPWPDWSVRLDELEAEVMDFVAAESA